MGFFYITVFSLFIVWIYRLKRVNSVLGQEYFLSRGSGFIPGTKPLVSILIPARNEEKNIERCVTSLLAQDYPDFEIIVISDRSVDRTEEIVANLAKQDSRVKLLTVSECPAGWSGKNNAITEGVKHAGGEYLVFTDSDTWHNPYHISNAVGYMIQQQVDLLSVNPHLVTASFWENVIMPIAGAVLMIWYPIEKINDHSSQCSYANGQFIIVKKDAYERIGGHSSVKAELLEDLAIARRIKQLGLRLRVLWGPDMYKTHMYTSLPEIWRGWVRIFSHGLNRNLLKMSVSMLLIVLFSISPYIFFLWSLFLMPHLLPLLASIALIIFMYYVIIKAYRVANANKWYVISHFLGCVMVFLMLLHCGITVIFKKKIVWRGIAYPS